MTELLHNPLVLRTLKAAALGLVAGVAAAAHADYSAFKTWNSFDDAHKYNWGVAGWRWFKGAVTGVVGGVGTALVGTGIGAMFL